MFNNNSAQALQNQQQNQQQNTQGGRHGYQTRQNTGSQNTGTQNNSMGLGNNSSNPASTNNLFNNQTQGNNIFANTQTGGGGGNLFTQSQPTGGLFQNNSGTTQNIFQTGLQNTTTQNSAQQLSAYRVHQEFSKLIVNIFEMQKKAEVQKLIILIEKTLDKCKYTIERASKESQNIKKESSNKAANDRKLIEKRCLDIKERNTSILVSMMNLKQKMMHKMYQQKVRVPENQAKMEILLGKIKETAARIKEKKNQFHIQKKFNLPTEPKKKEKNSKSVSQPMVELRKATQLLGRETLRIKTQFDLCSRCINGDQIMK